MNYKTALDYNIPSKIVYMINITRNRRIGFGSTFDYPGYLFYNPGMNELDRIKKRESRSLWGRALSWSIYDFANTIFSMNIITMYFAQWIVEDLGFEDIFYSVAFAASQVMIALTMPALGALADARRTRLRALLVYTVLTCAFLVLIGQIAFFSGGAIWVGVVSLIAFAFANYFYGGSLTFYNALLPSVSTDKNIGKVSGLGVSLGYLGAIIGLFMVWPFVNPGIVEDVAGLFGATAEGTSWGATLHSVFTAFGEGRPASFIPTALLFFIFALPTFLWVKESREGAVSLGIIPATGKAFKRVIKTFKEIRKYPDAFRFLIAKLLFEDPIQTTIAFMAVFAGQVMGLSDDAKIPLFVTATTCAVIGSLVAGWLTDKIGPKKTLIGTVIGWTGVFLLLAFANHTVLFWIAGALVGIGLGFTWTSSRPLFASLVPEERLGEFFGLYALSGRAAAIMGPLVWGGVVLALNSLGTIKYRFAAASLALFTIAGLVVLWGVKTPEKNAR
jgi:UMF1 family MFS transporter